MLIVEHSGDMVEEFGESLPEFMWGFKIVLNDYRNKLKLIGIGIDSEIIGTD